MLEMAEHQYDIVHKSEILHVDADALSRCPLQAGPEDPTMNVFITVAMDEVDLWDAKCFKEEQAKDEHTEKILKDLKDPKCRAVIAECYSIVNGPLQGKRAGLLQPIVPDGVPASHWGADFMGPMQKGMGGVKYILIAVDYMTRFVVVRAARTGWESDAEIFEGMHHSKVWMDEEIVYGSRDTFKIAIVARFLQEISD